MTCVALGGSGCATAGPNHLYTVSPSDRDTITDHAAPGLETLNVPSFLQTDDTLLGLAYDSYTDHLFLRLAPGNEFRVVDRPDHSIKYNFTAPEVPVTGGGDIAIRSRDRHLFLSHPTEPALIEITLYGKYVRAISLDKFTGPVRGVAYDQKRNRFYLLRGGDLAHIVTYDLDGHRLAGTALDRDVKLATLAYDSDAREFYAQLRENNQIGVFNEKGHLIRTIDLSSGNNDAHFDVGPRSFLRLF